jgi:hypothetical protein
MFVGHITWGKAILKILRFRRAMGINPQKIFEFVEIETQRENFRSEEMENRICLVKDFRDQILASSTFKARRVGRNGDGGYVVPDLEYNKVVSIGIGHETSFEEDASLFNSRIFMFDHTVSAPSNMHQNVQFYKIGVAEKPGLNFMTFEAIIEIAQLDESENNLLKVDIEGSEYDALYMKNFSQFAVVVIELHHLDKVLYSKNFAKFAMLFEKLSSEHHLFHAHANNWGKLFNFGNIVIPNVIELTFIRQNLIVQKSEKDKRELDFPCKPGFMEIWPLG